jgi:hypothetical protein
LLSDGSLVLLRVFSLLLGVVAVEGFAIGALPALNVPREEEPNLSIGILEKLCLHLQDFLAVHFLCVVTVLQTLFVHIRLVVTSSEQVAIAWHFLIVVEDLLLRVRLVQGSEEVPNDGVTATAISLDASLDKFYVSPVFV